MSKFRISFKHTGNFMKTESFLLEVPRINHRDILNKYGRIGVDVLASVTPVDSGETSQQWGYEIVVNPNGYSIFWTNTNINHGVPIAVILEYGHATRNGGFVEGRHYIVPAIEEVFNKLANDLWREVTGL